MPAMTRCAPPQYMPPITRRIRGAADFDVALLDSLDGGAGPWTGLLMDRSDAGRTRRGPSAPLDADARGLINILQKRPRPAGKVLVHGLSCAAPVAVVIEDQNPPRSQSWVERFQANLGRFVPICVKPEDGYRTRQFAWSRKCLPDIALDEPDFLTEKADVREVCLDLLSRRI